MIKYFQFLRLFLPIRFEVAAAIAVGSAAAGIAGSAMSADAAGGAADSQLQAQREANASNEKIAREQIQYLKQSRDQANMFQRPFANIGLNAQNRLAYMLGLGNMAYEFNDAYGGGSAPKTYEWQDWVNDTNRQIKNLESKTYKKGSSDYVNQQRQIQMAKLKLVKDNQNTQSAFNNYKKAMDEKLANAPNSEPMYKGRRVPINGTYGSLMRDFGEKFKFTADPGYQFRLQQGNQALNNRLSAMGLMDSGRALKEGMRFNQGLATDEFGKTWGRYLDRYNMYNTNRQNKFNMLSGIGGAGQQAATQIGSNANQFGAGVSNALGNLQSLNNQNINAAGDSRAAGLIGQSNAWNSGLQSVGNALGAYAGYKYGGNKGA